MQRRYISIPSAMLLTLSLPLAGGLAYAQPSEGLSPRVLVSSEAAEANAVQIEGKGQKYDSLAAAVKAASENDTIKLLKPLTLSDSESTISIDKDITIDLNGQGDSSANPALKREGTKAIFNLAKAKTLTLINSGSQVSYITGGSYLITGAGKWESSLWLGKNVNFRVSGYRSAVNGAGIYNYGDSVHRVPEVNQLLSYPLKSIQPTTSPLSHEAKEKTDERRPDPSTVAGLVDKAYDDAFRTDGWATLTYTNTTSSDATLTRNETYSNLYYIKAIKAPGKNAEDPEKLKDEAKLYLGEYTLRAFFSADETKYADYTYTVTGTALPLEEEPDATDAEPGAASSPEDAAGTIPGEGTGKSEDTVDSPTPKSGDADPGSSGTGSEAAAPADAGAAANSDTKASSAAEKRIYSGALQWSVKSSFLKYMQANAKRSNPASPTKTDGFITYSNTAEPVPAQAKPSAETGQSWGEGSGSCTGAICTVKFPGSIHYAAHYLSGKWNLDLRLENLELVTTSASAGALYGDVSSAKLTGGTFTQKRVKIADLALSAAPTYTADKVTIKAKATLSQDAVEAFGGFYKAGDALDELNYVGNLKKTTTDTTNPGKVDSGKGSAGSDAGKSAAVKPVQFSDVATYPFVKEIQWLAASGVTTGYPDKTFRPHDSVSRAAMAAFLYRLEGKPDYKAPAKSPFTDIKPGDDFYKEICWLASKGITTGYADGSFKPWDSISREAMAAFLHRYDSKVAAKKLATKLAAKKFTDTAATPFAKDIAWLSSTGVTTGYADGTFRPYDPIERGAIAAFFYRMKH